MTINNVIIRSGIICAVTEELPKEPIEDTLLQRNYYHEALQRIKDNAVPFQDWKKVRALLGDKPLAMETFYRLSVEVEIVTECECLGHEPKTLPCALNDKHCKATKFARIVEEPVEKKCPKCRTLKPENCHSMHCPMRVSEVEKEPEDRNRTKILMDVWQKWCELDYEEFDGWLHSELHKNNP